MSRKRRVQITGTLAAVALMSATACSQSAEDKFHERWNSDVISDDRAFSAAQTMCSGLDSGESPESLVFGEVLKLMGEENGSAKAQELGKAMGVGVLTLCPEHEERLRQTANNWQ